MKIKVKYVPTDIGYDYRPEYTGFVLKRYDSSKSRWNSVLLNDACLWKIDHLQKVLKTYESIL